MFDIATIISFLLAIILIGKKSREKVNGFFNASSYKFWLLPIAPIAIYISFIISGNNNVSFANLPAVILYFFLPTLIVYWSKKTKNDNFLLNAIFVLLIWLPVEFGLVPIMWTSGKQPPILFSFATLFYILMLATYSKSLPLYCDWKLSKNDLRLIINIFIILVIII